QGGEYRRYDYDATVGYVALGDCISTLYVCYREVEEEEDEEITAEYVWEYRFMVRDNKRFSVPPGWTGKVDIHFRETDLDVKCCRLSSRFGVDTVRVISPDTEYVSDPKNIDFLELD